MNKSDLSAKIKTIQDLSEQIEELTAQMVTVMKSIPSVRSEARAIMFHMHNALGVNGYNTDKHNVQDVIIKLNENLGAITIDVSDDKLTHCPDCNERLLRGHDGNYCGYCGYGNNDSSPSDTAYTYYKGFRTIRHSKFDFTIDHKDFFGHVFLRLEAAYTAIDKYL